MKHNEYEKYIKVLYKLVEKSYNLNEIPVGSIVIYNNKIIGTGYNNRQFTNNVCGHAEINAINEAEKYLNDWRLNDCILISSLHPCKMCQQVIKEVRIDKVFYFFDQNNVNNNNYNQIYFPGNKYIECIEKMFNDFFKNIR